MGTCPDCEENFDLQDDAEAGDLVQCPRCNARLEVLNVFPVTFDYAPEENA